MPTTRSSAFKAELDAESKRTLAKIGKADALRPLRKSLMLATQPLVPAARAAARELPSKDKRTRDSLRSALARAVNRKVRVAKSGIAIVVSVLSKGGKANLARAVEGLIPWQHPTYGHEPTVTQEPHPWFFPAMDEHSPEISRQAGKMLREVDHQL